jgi:hypothetical protein
MNRSPIPCHLCQRFTVTGRNAPQGHGYCDGYETFRRHDDTNEACPLFSRAKDEAKRRAWAERQKENT